MRTRMNVAKLTVVLMVALSSRTASAQYIYGQWDSLTVATYNIHSGIGGLDGQYSLERVVGVINQANADIVLLQEVDRRFWDGRSHCQDQVARLAVLLPQYPFQAFEPKDGGRWFLGPCGVFQAYEYGMMVLSKVPLLGYQRTYLENSGAVEGIPVQKFNANVRGLSVAVYGVHLDLNHSPAVRQLQSEQLVRFVNQTSSGAAVVVVGGDFNDSRDIAGFQPIRARPLYSNSPLGIVDLVWSSWAFDGYVTHLGSKVESDHELRLHQWWWFRYF